MPTQNLHFPILRSSLLQSGNGVPSHVSPLGSTYVDLSSGIEYLNNNGISYWVEKLSNASTGATINGNISANSITDVNFINFKTNPIVPSVTGGTLYFDLNENALSYKPITVNNDVTVNLGQESLILVYNNTNATILNGKAVHITGSTSGVPTIMLASASATATTLNNAVSNVSGVATHDILPNTKGFITNFGVVRDIDTSSFNAGDEIYLSDTINGGYTNNPNSLKTSSRISIIGWVITSSVTGKILVVTQNEDTTQTLTNKERNILIGDVASSGLYEFTGITTSATTFSVAPVKGWVVLNTGNYSTAPSVINVQYSGGTNIPLTYLSGANNTFLLVTSAGTLTQQTTLPTPKERRENIFLGKVIHPNRTTIQNANNLPDYSVSTMSALRDLWVPLRAINMGVVVSPNGTNLSLNQSSGTIWGNGFGWVNNPLTPNTITLSAQTPATFQYRTQTGGTTSNLSSLIPSNYDLNGVVTPVGGGANSSTNQRVYIFSTGVIRIQYGQQVYGSLADAVAGLSTETFIEFENNRDNGLLIGVISVNKNATALNDSTKAIFHIISKFGEISAGGAGGSSTTTLQQAYDNSTSPEIVINATLDGLSIKNGTGNADNITKLIEGVNTVGNTTSFIQADGLFSGTTFKTSGFTANNTGLSATTVSATTYLNLPNTVFTGGTVSGATQFSGGLSANTFSATTIYSPTLDDYLYDKYMTNQYSYFLPSDASATYSAHRTNGGTILSVGTVSTLTENPMGILLTTALAVGSVAGQYGTVVGGSLLSTNFQFEIIRKFRINTNNGAQRFFAGISSLYSSSAPTNIDPLTQINSIGVCKLQSGGTMNFMWNDATGTASYLDLGSNFMGTATTVTYKLKISKSYGVAAINMELTKIDNTTGAVLATATTFASDYNTGVSYYPVIWMGNNTGVSGAVSFKDYGCQMFKRNIIGS